MAGKNKPKNEVTSMSLASNISKFSGEEGENIKFFIENKAGSKFGKLE